VRALDEINRTAADLHLSSVIIDAATFFLKGYGAVVAEAGVTGYRADFALAMYAPKGTPEAIVARFRDDIARRLEALET